ncbi:hypothetical protein CRE_13493 [Caenorhabditis remanei]|uniref:Uncharacterized protein n=1 Tax=Caenorhabditis remanei TaxID=31234 RepID=E3MRA5_CAERE|nr:hypothetical protein CRE_13493 [Caenorhabditis remanei]
MKLQFAIILIFALIICDLVSAESEKTSEIVGRKKFNRRGKMLGEDGKPEKRSVSHDDFLMEMVDSEQQTDRFKFVRLDKEH